MALDSKQFLSWLKADRRQFKFRRIPNVVQLVVLILFCCSAVQFSAESAFAQACEEVSAPGGGFKCKAQNAICSPPDMGGGSSGKCETEGGASNYECDCVGKSLPSYSISAVALAPNPIIPGAFAESIVTITPEGGYTGRVAFACTVVGKGGTSSPTCSIQTVTVKGTQTSSLVVQSANATPAGSYQIQFSSLDANGLGSSNGPQTLNLSVALPPNVSNFCPTGTCDISTPVFLDVYWDTSPQQWDTDTAGTPGLTEANLDAFVSTLAHSSYFTPLMQYSVTSATAIPGFTASNCGPPPATIDLAIGQFGTFLSCVLSALPSSSAIFNVNVGVMNVFLPPQTAPATPTSEFCATSSAMHDKFGFPVSVEMTVIPTNPRCHKTADAVFNSLSHEMVEAATDPIPASPTGWKQPFWEGGNEIADICSSLVAVPFQFPGGPGTVVQYWSDAAGMCVTGPPIPAPRADVLPTETVPIDWNSAETYRPFAVSAPCSNCSPGVKRKGVIWAAATAATKNYGYVRTAGSHAADLMKELEITAPSSQASLGGSGRTLDIVLFGQNKPIKAEVLGAIRIGFAGHNEELKPLAEPCTISMAVPHDILDTQPYHFVRSTTADGHTEWTEPSPTEVSAHGSAATVRVNETGTYLLVLVPPTTTKP